MTKEPDRGVLVVADDLTGANATAAGFARAGLRAVSVGAGGPAQAVAEFASRFDVVVVSTDSRHSPAEQAAARLTDVVRAGWPVQLVCARIDTTLRGNVGAVTEAALRTVSGLSGRRAVALCSPAHPAAGRHTVEGHQLLDGLRLEDTELAHDPRSPVTTSDVAETVRRQASLRLAALPLSLVTGEPDELCRAISDAVTDGADVLVADALTEAHLDRVAAAAARATADLDVVLVAVDPGPGSLALARALGVTGRGGAAPLLAVSGSATRLTRLQLQRLTAERAVRLVRVVTEQGTPLPDVEATAQALAEALEAAEPGETVLVATALEDSDVAEVRPADAEKLPGLLARSVRQALESHTVEGLFSTGGDISAALLDELDARGLEVEEEVVPLAVAGALVAGPWDGLPVVTKGGLVGDAATTVACLDHLARAAERRRRHVRAARSRPT